MAVRGENRSKVKSDQEVCGLVSVTGPELQNGSSKGAALPQSSPRGPAPYSTETASLGSKVPVPS